LVKTKTLALASGRYPAAARRPWAHSSGIPPIDLALYLSSAALVMELPSRMQDSLVLKFGEKYYWYDRRIEEKKAKPKEVPHAVCPRSHRAIRAENYSSIAFHKEVIGPLSCSHQELKAQKE
jgi:hypothetical protein